ncbi:DNA/RNA non-specific endonuclease [Rhodococcus chondri]|uniref:DNA/RNA non-specific endonuclease n=1 Tax=Rhodococcus chondri TaxID=3065941 RepID=A0ABU7JUL5_9NOCA|nr:DNA/RNA non-specific endonuclease [Rhodococcus sp. CC-R104]MEE2033716.1 DNA/RNA non-specific endonuclease [Rhodococcus sp. CC-R104]
MTIIDTLSTNGSAEPRAGSYESERHHQLEAAAQRIAERTEPRMHHAQVLRQPGGMAEANDDFRIIKRINHIENYYRSGEGTAPAPDLAAAVKQAEEVFEVDREDLLERIINTADFLGVRYLDEGTAAARSVGRVLIDLRSGRPRGYGTGFMVSPTLLLTNHHVLPDAHTARVSRIEFDYQDGPGGAELTPRTFGFDPDRFFIADRARDFALVAVDATPDALQEYGFSRLTAEQGTVIIGESVTIVQHPGGRKKQIVLRENRIIDIPERFVHYCADTEPGSSGSPVFNDQWEVVALHHASVPAPQHPQFGGVLNEGVRISGILAHVHAQDLPDDQRALLDELESVPARPSPELPAVPGRNEKSGEPDTVDHGDGTVTIRVPIEITVRLGDLPRVTPVHREAISIDPDYTSRGGYDPRFLATEVPLPQLGSGVAELASQELNYHHFSIVMHRRRRLALFTAVNIDGQQAQQPRRDPDRWILDPRLPADEQTGERVYADNPLDRGHLVRRLDPAWGPLAKAANDDTFHFTNCTPQHHQFNAGSTLWLGLEDHILRNTDNHDVKVTVMTGPVLADDDPQYRGVALPRQFWKVVAMVKGDGTLSATGYLLSQAALLDDFLTGPEEFSFGAYRTYQVPVRRIATMTGLGFAPHIAADPLDRIESSGAPRELLRIQDLIL